MFTESAELYDLIYASFKDYAAETAKIAALLRSVHPSCQTVLDVACGTGEHALLLASNHGFVVDGLDLDPQFVRIASGKHPTGRFVEADMTDFHLAQRYDAIICLFSSIGYLRTLERVASALRCFHEHLAPGGVVIIEPWFAPGILQPGAGRSHVVEAPGVRVERTSHITITKRISHLRFDYVITDAKGIRRSSETHDMGLFTPEEMAPAFQATGLAVQYDPKGLNDRGLYVARVAN